MIKSVFKSTFFIYLVNFGLVLLPLYGKCSAGNFLKKNLRTITISESKDTVSNIDSSYLKELIKELEKKWPNNHTINIVFHGHSVPSGYFKTPEVNTFDSYPLLILKKIAASYPTAVVNVIKTSIGGENAVQGAKRFKRDVLSHKPNLIFIDYALNDRPIGLKKAKKAWEFMIRMALKRNIKVVLMTPTPDISEDILDENAPLAQHTRQILELGREFGVPVVNPYKKFKEIKQQGKSLTSFMAQSNHINKEGHMIVAALIGELFGIPTTN
ncbi:GDSL-type esterase/lipase family protein [Pedobacter sp. L105]|uniref:SGNH/GDSL hydrolase family protein n=1 Tax=Pedobacter sp. L105 TaxID=1641871 RepID=UPI00131C84C9|nr:GDSL-type esterase/lipase family protein [Pedobacter sp. L105]